MNLYDRLFLHVIDGEACLNLEDNGCSCSFDIFWEANLHSDSELRAKEGYSGVSFEEMPKDIQDTWIPLWKLSVDVCTSLPFDFYAVCDNGLHHEINEEANSCIECEGNSKIEWHTS